MKRVVFLAAAAATLVQFTKYDLTALQTLGCEIHMVCNMQEVTSSEPLRVHPDAKWTNPQ